MAKLTQEVLDRYVEIETALIPKCKEEVAKLLESEKQYRTDQIGLKNEILAASGRKGFAIYVSGKHLILAEDNKIRVAKAGEVE